MNDISTRPILDLGENHDSITPYPGKVITYTLRYTNTSDMDTTGVVITTTWPAWLTSAPPGWTRSGAADVRPIGDLAARQNGSVSYVVTLPATYTLDMRAFIATFFIQDDGPGGLPKAHDQSTAFVGVPDLSIAQVIVPHSVAPGQKFTATVVISNGGLGVACNPKAPICGMFALDVFIAPTDPPQSYPFGHYGDKYTGVPVLGPGLSATVTISNIQFALDQPPHLYFKVDNWDCSIGDPCLPSGSQGGQVPEYNEGNNLYPHDGHPFIVPRYAVYLPLIRKNQP